MKVIAVEFTYQYLLALGASYLPHFAPFGYSRIKCISSSEGVPPATENIKKK